MTQSRTHTCGELRLANAGETVTLVGWMENIREVGNNFAFLVLRDFYGTTQVVIENEEMMNIVKPLNKESTRAHQQKPEAPHRRHRDRADGDHRARPLPL